MEMKDARSLSSEAQEALRKRAVQAVLEGRTHQETAQLCGVARGTVTRWLGLYRKQGEVGLDARSKGRSLHPALGEEEAAMVLELVSRHSPDPLGLPFFLWTREAVGELIKRRLGLALSQWTVGRHLKRWGFTPQKPARRAYEQNPAAVRRWLWRSTLRSKNRPRRKGRRSTGAMRWGPGRTTRQEGPGVEKGRLLWWRPRASGSGAT